MAHLLVVEDDKQLAPVLKSDLEFEGYTTVLASTIQKAKELFDNGTFDLVLLDISLPDGTGYEVCRHIRKANQEIPIIFLTARAQESDKIMGFKLGADDYVTKPFGIMELISRIKARLKNIAQKEKTEITIQSLVISKSKREVSVAGKRIDLTPKEFDILWLLALRKGEVINREEFLEQIWGTEAIVTTRTIDNQVGTMRQKIEAMRDKTCPRIETVHRVGYKLIEK
jgi:two-component system, OmpR family, alkaline phosphatase synthesis response regulator PhoP